MTETGRKVTISPWFFRAILISLDACDIQTSAKEAKSMTIQIFDVLGDFGYSKRQIIGMLKARKDFLSGIPRWKRGEVPHYNRTKLSEQLYEKFKKPYFAKAVKS